MVFDFLRIELSRLVLSGGVSRETENHETSRMIEWRVKTSSKDTNKRIEFPVTEQNLTWVEISSTTTTGIEMSEKCV